MRLWSIQPFESLEELENTGIFIPKKEKSRNINVYNYAYKWLICQMNEKLNTDYTNYPIWMWHTFEGERQEPNLDNAGFVKVDGKRILYNLDVPEDNLVLSDFEKWQFVLENTFVLDETISEEKLLEIENNIDTLPKLELQEKIEETWINVFNVKNSKYIQATMFNLKKEFVSSYKII